MISAVGRDQPGIIAAVSARLVAHGVNITDSHMGILRGHFAMTLVVTVPERAEEAALQTDLDQAAAELGLEALYLREVAEAPDTPAGEPTHSVVVYGADHPGIVAAVTGSLARSGVNVCDLRTRLAEDLYVMHLEVALPESVSEDQMRERLAAVAEQQGVDITVTQADADVL